jgi:hypothetical protein
VAYFEVGSTVQLGVSQPRNDLHNFHPRTGHEGPEGEKCYSSTLYLSSVVDGVGGKHHAPAVLPPGKTQYALYTRLGRPQGESGEIRKISPPPGFDSWTVHSVPCAIHSFKTRCSNGAARL